MANNETFGMSVEKAMCELYDLDNNIDVKRTNKDIMDEIKPIITNFFNEQNIKLTEYIGNDGNKDDFLLSSGHFMQVKTNINNSDKVCPPEIGQCTKRTFLNRMAKKINENIEFKTDLEIKNFIFNNPKKLLKQYIDAYYTSDEILYIKKQKNKKYFITLYKKINFNEEMLDECVFSFTKTPEKWNESSTMKLTFNNKTYSIGEFQIHNHRDGVKFRFNRNNFHTLIKLLL